VIKEVAKKAGLQVKRSIGFAVNGKEKLRYEIHSHVFRRYWKRQMKRAGITDGDFLDFLMGHELSYGSAYDKFDRDYVRKEYAKAEPFLSVMFNPEIQELQEEERLKSELAKKSIDAEAEFAKHPTWTRRDRKQWMDVMARQAIPRQKPETSKSKPKVELIDESQATNHLNHGYKLLAVMPSGKLLVEYVGEVNESDN
jgi:hypothetical protein